MNQPDPSARTRAQRQVGSRTREAESRARESQEINREREGRRDYALFAEYAKVSNRRSSREVALRNGAGERH